MQVSSSAACLLEVAAAPMQPARLAIRSSKAAATGLPMRRQMSRFLRSANRSAASGLSSKTKLVAWQTGTARAPVAGSGRPPARRARIANPHLRSSTMPSV